MYVYVLYMILNLFNIMLLVYLHSSYLQEKHMLYSMYACMCVYVLYMIQTRASDLCAEH